jgi:tetrahydromethanopterin S-methyltransferase subunit G
MSYTSVAHCGNSHLEWRKSIDFYKDEFNTLEKRLDEIVQKNNKQQVMAGVEHFQNQFIVQRNNLDELKHRIHEHEGKVAADVKIHAGKMQTDLVGEHDLVGMDFDNMEKVIKELRWEFNQFLSKWM